MNYAGVAVILAVMFYPALAALTKKLVCDAIYQPTPTRSVSNY